MMKQINYIILFILLFTGVALKDNIHISTNLLSLFASKDAIQKLNVADSLGYSKELLIAVKGFDKESKLKVQTLTKKLQEMEGIAFVQYSVTPSDEIQEYYKKYYTLLSDFDAAPKTQEEVTHKLQNIYDELFSDVFYKAVNKSDPLKLFSLENSNKINVTHKNGLITLGDYGYLIRAKTDVSPSQMAEAKVLYTSIHELLSSYDDVVSFAPFYYTVENSKKIQEDVQWIILLSTFVLLIIYYLLIKNMKLLSHTLIALFSSMVFAGLVSTLVFSNFNALSLAFGMSITAVSIDYLLHYHFHNFYQNKKTIDKNVLYGYLTTIVAFGIFTFIPIPIISQISFFAVVSLSFAYLLFTFVFPKLGIEEFVTKDIAKVSNKKIPAYIFSMLSVILFAYSAFNIHLDGNIRNLDYQNTKLLESQNLFSSFNTSKLTPVMVQAKSKNELLNTLHALESKAPNSFSLANFVPQKDFCDAREAELKSYDFQRLNAVVNEEATKIGFKDGYFKNAYHFVQDIPSCESVNLDIFRPYNLSIYEESGEFYTIALSSEEDVIKEFDFISSISAQEIFSELASQMYRDILLFSLIVVVVVFILLFFSVKTRLLYALNYILFPISLTLAILVSYTDINLMHIFSLIILIAIGIDYGIYMSNTQQPSNTMLAIKYSILSTFAAFGVLIFSSIVALNSIGIVITIGAATIFLLIKVMR